MKHQSKSFFLSGLLLLFIGLKLARFIDWSWWWVLAPFWMPIALVVLCLAFLGFAHLALEAKKSRRLGR